jgi:cold shock protein
MPRLTGTVAYWHQMKGYAFIRPDNNNDRDRDVFCHISAVQHAGLQSLEVGQRLTFDTEEDYKHAGRYRAVNLRLETMMNNNTRRKPQAEMVEQMRRESVLNGPAPRPISGPDR